MTAEGPQLESLTRRLAECPAEFLDEPRIWRKGRVNVAAVVNDLLLALGGERINKAQLNLIEVDKDTPQTRNRLRLILIACWLLHDPFFREAGQFAAAVFDFLTGGLLETAELTAAGKFVTDPDRREELARLCLKALDRRPAGETETQSQDRLVTLNTAERQRVIQAAREAEERAQQIREAMAKKAAEEAADKWGRE